jgi:serine-type D-Ala-D-Ala carboxypeptidase/endopeptidase (penicillin-binding protein 4)
MGKSRSYFARSVKRISLALALIAAGIISCPAAQAELSSAHSSVVTPEAKLNSSMSAWLSQARLQNSLVAVEVMQIPSGKVLFSANGNRRMVPASVAKVLTTACAFDRLGGDYRYSTQLMVHGEIQDDTIHGDLQLHGSQDPSLQYQDVRELFNQLKIKKIKKIDGNVRIAAAPAGGDYFFPGWLAEDWGQEWMPVSSDLVLDRNIAASADPGRGMPSTTSFGERNNNALISSLLLASELAPGWAIYDVDKAMVQAVRANGSGGLVIANPSIYHQALLEFLLKSLGVRINRQSPVVQESHVVSAHLSAPLSAIIKHTLHLSDNLYAQQLLRTIAATSHRKSASTSLEEIGLQEIGSWLNGLGVKSSEVVLVDGCGLSRKNCISPHALNMVFKHVAAAGFNSPYMELLKQLGSPSEGEFRFKTGSMDSVRTVSGVLRTAHGDLLAVTAMVNGHESSIRNLRALLDELAGILGTLPRLTNSSSSESVQLPVQAKPVFKNTVAKPRRSKKRRH